MILNSVEIETIANWTKENQVDVNLDLIVTRDSRSKIYTDFCDLLTQYSSNITVQIKKDFDKKEPFIKIKDNLIYQVIPKGKELDIFLELLTYKNTIQSRRCLNIKIPAFLKIYISEHCPFCPVAVREIASIALDNKDVIVTVVDGGLFHEMAQDDSVMSVPTVIFDNNLRWTGAVNIQDVIEVITNTKPEELSLNALKTMIESGNASSLATLMVSENKVFPFFYDLVTHEKWPVRLGAMVGIEHLAEEKNTLIGEVLDELWRRFNSLSTSVQGDILYLMGETGYIENIPRIESIMHDELPNELKEAAEEAMESLVHGDKSLK